MQTITNDNDIANMVRELAQDIPVIVQRSQEILSISGKVLAISQEISGNMKNANILGMITMAPQIEHEVQQGVVVMQQMSNGLKHIVDELKQLEARSKKPEEEVAEVLNELHLEL